MFSTFETIETLMLNQKRQMKKIICSDELRYTKQTHFLNQTSLEEYEKNRNMLYTKDILRKRIVIDSCIIIFNQMVLIHLTFCCI